MDHRTTPPPTSGGTERLLLAIGQVSATHRTVLTPSGTAPVNAVSWSLREEPTGRRRVWTPRSGASPDPEVRLTVTVSGPGWEHTERVDAATPEEVSAVRAKVTQARMLALRAVVWAPAVPTSAATDRASAQSLSTAAPSTVAPSTAVLSRGGGSTGPARPAIPSAPTGPSALPVPSGTVRVVTARVRAEVAGPAR